MNKMFLAVLSVLVISVSAFAKDKSVNALAIYGNSMGEVEKKVAVELKKMKSGNYYNKQNGRKCEEAIPYNVSFHDSGASYGVGADGSLTASRPMAWIKFTCINYSHND
jgi:hypothetical protein